MTTPLKKLVGNACLPVLLAASAHAFEIDSSSNSVFDLYFFGNGEVAQLGENLSGSSDFNTGLDLQQITGWMDWTGSETQSNISYWTEEQKKAVTEAVGAWTETIQNAYSGSRKLRIGFFLDDASRSESNMDFGMKGYASYATTTANPAGTNPTNAYSVVEWIWREGNAETVSPPAFAAGGSFWNGNLLPSQENCIEVAIVLNPEQVVFGDGTATRVPLSAETLKKVAMHELGHAMGMDSKMFAAGSVQTNLISTLDSLLMLDENQRVITLGSDGSPVYAYETFSALCDAGWSLYETWYNSGEGEENLLRLQNDKGEFVNVLVTAGTNAEGNSLIHLLGELGIQDHDDVLGPGGTQGDVFTELDLTALRLLGWQVIPEPATFGLFSGLVFLGLAICRRRRR